MGTYGAYMSKIDALMKQLEEKKLTISAFEDIRKSLENILSDVKYSDIRDSVISRLANFIDKEISFVEESALGEERKEPIISKEFDSEELGLLKTMLGKLKSKNIQKDAPSPTPPKPSIKGSPDKIQFALANRHLDGKTVLFDNNGNRVEGVVRGLDAPNVVVVSATGRTYEIPLSEIEIKGS